MAVLGLLTLREPAEDHFVTAQTQTQLFSFFQRKAGTVRRAGQGNRSGCCGDCDELACGDDQPRHGRYRHRFCVTVLLVLLQVIPTDLLFIATITGITEIPGFGREQAGTGRQAVVCCGKNGNSNQEYEKKKADTRQEQMFFHKTTTVRGICIND